MSINKKIKIPVFIFSFSKQFTNTVERSLSGNNLCIFRLVTPYSFVQFKVLTHNMVKKDSLLGEYKVDLYKVLKDNNGKITNFALALNIGDGNSDNSKLNVNLDGLKVDLTSYPPKQVSVQQNGKYVRLGLYSPIHLFLNFFRNTYIFKKA